MNIGGWMEKVYSNIHGYVCGAPWVYCYVSWPNTDSYLEDSCPVLTFRDIPQQGNVIIYLLLIATPNIYPGSVWTG